MVCPFRINIEFDYATITSDSGAESIMQVAQKETYPECEYGDCPFYNYNGLCDRTNSE